MMLATTMKKMVEEIKGLKEYYIQKAMKTDMFTDMNSEEMALLWKVFKLMDLSTAAMVEQAEALDDMTRKIDKLLENAQKGEA